jgi:hypothetical protein
MIRTFVSSMAGAAMLLVASAASAEVGADQAWGLRLPQQDKLVFRGAVRMDDIGKAGNMMYPTAGLGVAGLLVGIVTHGVIANGQLEREKSQREEAADKVLDPFRGSLDRMTVRQVLESALGQSAVGRSRLLAADEQAGEDWVVEIAPVFSMSQDQAALILDNAVVVRKPGQAEYKNFIRVVSDAQRQEALTAYWLTNDGKALKDVSAQLVALSLDIVLNDAALAAKPAGAQRTVRYVEGTKEVFERAEVLSENCGRSVVRNLRGWLMSLPLAKRDPAAACGS